LQHRFASDLKHWFGQFLGELAHARSATGGEKNRFGNVGLHSAYDLFTFAP
jgi:hypothetical protein